MHLQLKVERAIAEPLKEHKRCGILGHGGVSVGNLMENFQHQFNIRTICHPYRDVNPGKPIGICPVNDLVGNKIGIGNHNIGPIKSLNYSGSETNLFNLSPLPAFNRSSFGVGSGLNELRLYLVPSRMI